MFPFLRSVDTCELPSARTADGERRARWWIALSFVFCPCHLPVTLSVLGVLAGGTAIGSLIDGHRVLVGVSVSLVWLAGTGYGFRLLHRADRVARTALALDEAADTTRADDGIAEPGMTVAPAWENQT